MEARPHLEMAALVPGEIILPMNMYYYSKSMPVIYLSNLGMRKIITGEFDFIIFFEPAVFLKSTKPVN